MAAGHALDGQRGTPLALSLTEWLGGTLKAGVGIRPRGGLGEINEARSLYQDLYLSFDREKCDRTAIDFNWGQ